ncbi:MAG: hypothetical protein HKN10_07585 [Myxococcales bacterium]|nr:hypothetical protein [Myxococcales bacterium]
MGKTRLKTWGFRVVTLGLTLLLLTVVFEVGFRLVYPQYGGCKYSDRDAELGWRLSPGHSARCVSRGHRTVSHIEISHQGFRSPAVEVPKPPGMRRIFMLGDSMTFGTGIGASETTAAVLEARLRETDSAQPLYEVVNAGTPGYGTAQQWLLYQRWADELDPDAVILMFFIGNDLENNVCYSTWETHPCFRLENGELVLESALPEEEPARRESWSLGQLHTYIFFHDRLQSLAIANPTMARLLATLGYQRKLTNTLHSWYDDEFLARSWGVTEALLNALEADVRADGIPLILVILPSSPQTTESFRQMTELLYGETPEGAAFFEDSRLPQRRLLGWAKERGVIAIDPLDAMERAAAGGSIYLPDRHFNPLGARIIAQEIENALTSEGVLDPS